MNDFRRQLDDRSGAQAVGHLRLVAVIEGAGGTVTGSDGGDPLAASGLLASGDAALHQEALRLLAGT